MKDAHKPAASTQQGRPWYEDKTINTRTVEEQLQASADTNAGSAFDGKSSSSSDISTRSDGQCHVQRGARKGARLVGLPGVRFAELSDFSE